MINYFKLTSFNINTTAASLISLISAPASALTSRNLNRLDCQGLSTILINAYTYIQKQTGQHPDSGAFCIKEQATIT